MSFFAWFDKLFSSEQSPVLSVVENESPYRDPGPDPLPDHYREPMPTPVSSEHPFTSMMREATKQVASERARIQESWFDNGKTRGYFQKAITFMVREVDKNDFDFILLHDHQAGVPQEAWPLFSQIFMQVCKEMGLHIKNEGTYLTIQKADLRKLLEKMDSPKVDVQEQVRT